MSLRPDDKRFIVLLGVVFAAVVVLTMAARFLGSVLWPGESPVADTAQISSKGSGSRPSSSGARQSADAPSPKAPPVRVTVQGSIPPEFVGLEGKLAGMDRDLSIRRVEHRALREKVAAADALILRAEGSAPGDGTGSPLPSYPPGERGQKEEGHGKNREPDTAADVTRLRQRLEALGPEGKAPIRGSAP